MSTTSVVLRTVWILALCGVLTAVGILRRRPPLLVILYAVAVTATALIMVLSDLAWRPEDGASFAGIWLILVSFPACAATFALPQSFYDNNSIVLTEGVLILAAYLQVALLWAILGLAGRSIDRLRRPNSTGAGDPLGRHRWKV